MVPGQRPLPWGGSDTLQPGEEQDWERKHGIQMVQLDSVLHKSLDHYLMPLPLPTPHPGPFLPLLNPSLSCCPWSAWLSDSFIGVYGQY